MLTALTGCANKGGASAGAQSPERQSDAEYDLARDLFQKGNPRAALDHALKAVSFNEDNDKAQYFVAVIHLSFCSTNRGLDTPDCRLGEVEKYARAALKANPSFRDATNMLGQVLINEQKYKEAIVVLEPLTRDPAYVHPYFAWGNLGWAQVEGGQVDAGITSLKNAVAAEPRFCVGQYRLGVAFEKKGDLALAEQSFTSAVSVPDPNCESLQDAWEARGRARLKLGRSVEARQDFERCREISSETATGKSCVRQLAALPAGSASPGSTPGTGTSPAGTGAAKGARENP
ncbi:TPR domain protein, putative component of TonB system [Labilithrix luteola]|uniref:TPR domain protein, putative component of TonB system n=1 Tax=Labilithrix luteola TaxID=1391654 RepID=A0A0K1Q7C5_9BACT|nr:tetratricopeptide repeat protein [Labilithrix luteola]AKV01648.1 TPR domain protein, putative component of TonB system [Labilithrix luteola]